MFRAPKFSKPFGGSKEYWIERYVSGGNSGLGSYGYLAEFKAQVVNDFVVKHDIKTIIEYGCGDGNQLKLAKYPSYTGFDVSPQAVAKCRNDFFSDASKTFKTMKEYRNETAELTLSLDVIYHLVEDEIFVEYIYRLFNSSERYVIIYSSNTNENSNEQADHIKHRKFTKWVDDKIPYWKLMGQMTNKYPFNRDNEKGSFSDFFFYERI